MVRATIENIMEVPLKGKKGSTIWSGSATPKRICGENQNSKRCMHPSVHCTTIYNIQDVETYKMSMDRWTDKKDVIRASLVAQWLRIRLPMQGTRVRALAREDPTCRGATKPMHHYYWAWALEPASHNYWSLCAATTEACAPRACAPRQVKPPQWEACAPQQRVAPAHCN